MIILIPFQLLRFRELMKQKRSPETLEALKSLIKNDIIGSINENLRIGNITLEDALKLKKYTQTLYDYLYAHYNAAEACGDMTDESYMTDIDLICKEYEEALAAKDRELTAKDRERNEALAAKDREIATKDRERDEALAAKDKEIAQLKEQLAKLQAQ